MNILESVRIALDAIWVNKMRSLLTMLGIIIGIASVITIVALGNGMEKAMADEFEKIGVGRIFIGMDFSDGSPAQRDQITKEDIEVISRVFEKEIKTIQPMVSESGKVYLASGKNKTTSVGVEGANADFQSITNVKIVKGRFISEEDVYGTRQTVVIDQDLAKQVFGTTDVLGSQLLVNIYNQNVAFTVIGVSKLESSILGGMGGNAHTLYIPLSTAEKVYGYGDTVWFVQGAANLDYDTNETLKKVIKLLERRHDNVGQNKFRVENMEDQMSTLTGVMTGVTAVVSAIAAVSLLVGGIGVMNIMLVSVTERTREIGIRKALGAKYREIMNQFLIEAVIISSLGGMIGTAIGIGLAMLISALVPFLPDASASPQAILLAWLFSAGVGVVFGIFPASKAAKLNPIDALRYE